MKDTFQACYSQTQNVRIYDKYITKELKLTGHAKFLTYIISFRSDSYPVM